MESGSFGIVADPVVPWSFSGQNLEGLVEGALGPESGAVGDFQNSRFAVLGICQSFFNLFNAVAVEKIEEGFSDFVVNDPGQLMGRDIQPLRE